MECMLFNRQYIGKAETVFNIRLDNHGKDIKNPNAILVSQQQGHIFNSQSKFIIIDKLANTSSSKDILCECLVLYRQSFSSVRTEPRTQQIENENPCTAFLCSFLPRPQQPSHLRTQMMSQHSKIYLTSCNDTIQNFSE